MRLGARLKRLGVPTIIVEKNERPGDSWRKRYKSLCLHDPVWYDHMPYIPFPDDWPVFSPKDKLGDWLEMYAKVMELNYWGSTLCESASYDEAKQEWTVKVVRNGKPVTLKPKQLVLATGMSAVPNMPKFPGMEKFKGEQHHSSKHPGPDAYAGKKCVVIGSNNSAHDICAALWEAGADVTMIQRSSTHVARSDSLMELDLGPVYSEQAVARGIDVDTADMLVASVPYKLKPKQQIEVFKEIAKRDADFYARLEKAGFMHDWGDDGSGLGTKYMRRGSGYYIDVGRFRAHLQWQHQAQDARQREGNQGAFGGVQRRQRAAGRSHRLCHGLWLDEWLGGGADQPGGGGQGRQGLGPGLKHHEGSRPLGRRAAQHVEAHPAGRPVVPRRKPGPVAAVFAVPGAAAQGAERRHCHAGLREGGGASQVVVKDSFSAITAASERNGRRAGVELCLQQTGCRLGDPFGLAVN